MRGEDGVNGSSTSTKQNLQNQVAEFSPTTADMVKTKITIALFIEYSNNSDLLSIYLL